MAWREAASMLVALASASYQLPHGTLPDIRHRAPRPTLGFFEDMKKGFDVGMGSAEPREESAKGAPAASFFEELKKSLINAAPTAEERVAARVRAGEGVVWSADFSRVWMATKGMPQGEITVAEALEISEELSIPIPAEVEARLVD